MKQKKVKQKTVEQKTVPAEMEDTLEYLQTASTKHGHSIIDTLIFQASATGGCTITGSYTYDVKDAIRKQFNAHWNKAQGAWVTHLSVAQVQHLLHPHVKVITDEQLKLICALEPCAGPVGYISYIYIKAFSEDGTYNGRMTIMDFDGHKKELYEPVFKAIRAAGFYPYIHENYD